MFSWWAHLGSQTELGNGCIVGAVCSLTSRETLPDNTVVCGAHCERRLQLERPPVNIFLFLLLFWKLPEFTIILPQTVMQPLVFTVQHYAKHGIGYDISDCLCIGLFVMLVHCVKTLSCISLTTLVLSCHQRGKSSVMSLSSETLNTGGVRKVCNFSLVAYVTMIQAMDIVTMNMKHTYRKSYTLRVKTRRMATANKTCVSGKN